MDEQQAAEKNYYSALSDLASGLKFRIDPKKELREVMDTFEGVQRDQYGRVLLKNDPLMNAEGIARTRGFLRGTITVMTHLSKYENEERVNRQARHFIKQWVYIVVRYKKIWGITNLRAVVAPVEKLLYESMLRATSGFEAELTAKSHQVLENVRRDEGENRGGMMGLFGRKRRQQEWQY